MLKYPFMRLAGFISFFLIFCVTSLRSHAESTLKQDLDEYFFQTTESFSAEIEAEGKVLYSNHAKGFHANSKHLYWSAAKSITVTLLGMAIYQKKLNLQTPLCEVVDEVRTSNPDLCTITVEDFIFWVSGIQWAEVYEKNATNSDVVEILFGTAHSNMAAYALARKKKHNARLIFNYSSGDSLILSKIIRKVWPEAVRLSSENPLARALDLKNFVLSQDSEGTFVGSSFLYSSTEDMRSIGRLYLQQGKWNGQQILSKEFVNLVTNPLHFSDKSFSYSASQLNPQKPHPAGHWWSNALIDDKVRPWPSFDPKSFSAMGHWGQVLLVSPAHKLIMTRTGDDRKKEKFEIENVGKILKAHGILK